MTPIRDAFPVPQVIHTFLVSFNEQRRPIMPLLTAMRRTQKLSEEQRALREAWDALTEKVGKTPELQRCSSVPTVLRSVERAHTARQRSHSALHAAA